MFDIYIKYMYVYVYIYIYIENKLSASLLLKTDVPVRKLLGEKVCFREIFLHAKFAFYRKKIYQATY